MVQIDERMEMIAGMRPKGEKARAIKVTVFKRWQDSMRLELRPGVGSWLPAFDCNEAGVGPAHAVPQHHGTCQAGLSVEGVGSALVSSCRDTPVHLMIVQA